MYVGIERGGGEKTGIEKEIKKDNNRVGIAD
jgi:hypothetical protein